MQSNRDVVVEAWDGILFDKFTRFKHLLTEGLAQPGDDALNHSAYPEGFRVLDIGCGFGDTTRAIARKVGAKGQAVGVDCSPRFVEAARKDAEGTDNASFFVGDVQRDDLGGPWNAAFSRFGTMFFTFPGAALRNVRRALAPEAEFTQVVWRKREDNPWLHDAELCVKSIVPVVPHDETDAVHCGPGPFSMAGADLVSEMLMSAGFERVRFERLDVDICIGRSLEEAVAFAEALGPAGEIVRLAGDEGERRLPEVRAALTRSFEGRARPDGSVWHRASTWVVRARNPG